MIEPDDLVIARRLQAHYRETAAADVPVTLLAEVRDMFSSTAGRHRLPTSRLAAVIAAVLVVIVGTAFAIARPGFAPPSSGSTPLSLTPTDSPGVAGSASAPASSPTPSPSVATRIDDVAILRGAAIGSAVAGATDDAPFLIGGRLSYLLVDCLVAADFPATPLLTACGGGPSFRDDVFQAPLAADMEATGLTYADGDIVVRVHTRDGRAADCPANYRVRCELAIVVEQVVWRSDANGSGTIPATLSILPPEVEPDQCAKLAFEPVRCVAVVERARGIIGIGWPDIQRVTLARPSGGDISLGSVALADVVFHDRDGTDHDAQIRCLFLRSVSLVCGPATVHAVSPSP